MAIYLPSFSTISLSLSFSSLCLRIAKSNPIYHYGRERLVYRQVVSKPIESKVLPRSICIAGRPFVAQRRRLQNELPALELQLARRKVSQSESNETRKQQDEDEGGARQKPIELVVSFFSFFLFEYSNLLRRHELTNDPSAREKNSTLRK